MKIIAVIDDDIPIGDMLTEVLSREGYAVLETVRKSLSHSFGIHGNDLLINIGNIFLTFFQRN